MFPSLRKIFEALLNNLLANIHFIMSFYEYVCAFDVHQPVSTYATEKTLEQSQPSETFCIRYRQVSETKWPIFSFFDNLERYLKLIAYRLDLQIRVRFEPHAKKIIRKIQNS